VGSRATLLEAVAGLRVLVIGDALLADYLLGGSSRICREAPVPAVTVDRHALAPGGAANAAANVAALGGDVRFLSVVGDDAAGRALRRALGNAGVADADVLTEPGRVTVAKRRLVAGEQMLLRYDEGGPDPVAGAADELQQRLEEAFAAVDAVLVSDYGYGVLAPPVVEALARLQQDSPLTLVVDARDPRRFADLGPTAVTPNYTELLGLLPDLAGAAAPDRARAVVENAGDLHAATGAQVVAVTLDRDGAVVCEQRRPPYRTWTKPAPHSRACGAGDSYAAALTLGLAAGADVPSVAELAQGAAAVVTARAGTSTCSAEDLRGYFADTTTPLQAPQALAELVAFHRRQGRRVVFTNGCFDILHRGHVDLLNRAKSLGDVLVVGLNSDASIRSLKGPDRPINRLVDRASVLAALSCVDHLVAFDGRTAAELVAVLKPEVYVKGGDYTPDMLPEAPHVEAYGGVVRILPYLQERSTTALIDRIRAGSAPVAAEQSTP
jgi:D-beta-D-heptose 7-phosphate kinase/D-beta-D-heptose 1-phosphate adenosyltransferase